MIRSDDPTTLSLLFHLNSEPWLDEDAYRGAAVQHEFKDVPPAAAPTALPAPTPSPLAGLILRRRSARAFAGRPLPLAAVSALASATYGVVELAPMPGGAFLRRAVPSAGGLYPLELFVFLQRVEGLADGLYHYDVRGHALSPLRPGWPAEALRSVFLTYPFVRDANLVVCFAAAFPRAQKKYGPRGYRYVLLEAGHAAQNLCLAAAEHGLGSLCMGGFMDGGLNRLLGLDPRTEGVVYAVAVGCT